MFLPLLSAQGTGPSPEQPLLQEAQARYPASEGFSPRLTRLTVSGEWALGVISLGVAMADVSGVDDTVFALAHQTDGSWQAALSGDVVWSGWLEQAPEALLGKPLREYLLDQAVEQLDVSAAVAQRQPALDLRLPV